MSDDDTDLDALDGRLRAVERALTGGEADAPALREAAAVAGDVECLDARVADLERRVEELDAAVQAVRGYAGSVSGVNEAVERRAEAALATAERVEADLAGRGRLAVPDGPPPATAGERPGGTGGERPDAADDAADAGASGLRSFLPGSW